MTIAQIVYDNELYFGSSDADIHNKVFLTFTMYCTALIRNVIIIAHAHMERHG
jgi:hypothetical protein